MACRLLATIAPGDITNAFICNSGTESVDGAMKIARVATGRSGFICAEGAFHGKTLGSLSLMGRAAFREPVEPLLGPVWRAPFGDAAAFEEAIAGHAGECAAVVLEPIQGEAGAVVPPDDFLPRVRAACDEHEVLLIADEVQTGLGRTGALWAVEHSGIVPDILCLAKALGGGVMPVGAILGRPHVWKALEPNPFLHTSTFGGNPLACAAAIAAINVILRDRLWEAAAAKGERILDALGRMRARHAAGVQVPEGAFSGVGAAWPQTEGESCAGRQRGRRVG
jgi:putrescine aminotransferase